MQAAEQLAADEPVLTWDEIVARYPDQYVCLVDIENPEPRHPLITRARVVGNGLTRRDAFARERCRGIMHTVRFTGKSSKPLSRPTFIFDEEDLELLHR